MMANISAVLSKKGYQILFATTKNDKKENKTLIHFQHMRSALCFFLILAIM